jgi:hypothetical protein
MCQAKSSSVRVVRIVGAIIWPNTTSQLPIRHNVPCRLYSYSIRSREEDHRSFLFCHNIVYFNDNQLLGGRWENGNFDLDNNVYWSTLDEVAPSGARSLKFTDAPGLKASFNPHLFSPNLRNGTVRAEF